MTEPTPNERIRTLRHAHGWTQQQAADAIAAAISQATGRGRPTGIDAQWIGRLERGERRWPNADRAALHAVYGTTTDAELGLSGARSPRSRRADAQSATSTVAQPTRVTINREEVATELDPDTGELDEMNRRDLLRTLSVAGALIALPPDSTTGSNRPRTVDPADLDDYEQLNSHLWQVYSLAKSKRAVYPLVRQQIEFEISDGNTAKLTREQKGRFVALCWIAQIHKHIPDPKPSYLADWDKLPEWQQQTNADIFEHIEQDAKQAATASEM